MSRLTAPERRIDILRQLALSPNGLRIREIKGCSDVTAGQRINELMREGFVTQTATGNPCSPRHRASRYRITTVGRLALAELEPV
jgi:DNA-binding IclR family transcriptional regulator